MRAALSLAGEPWLEIAEVPDPTPAPDGLVLRVEACGICGSDLHLAAFGRPGITFGHEICGTVVAVGTEVTGHREGDRVVGFPLVGCGTCVACLTGATPKCARARLVGAALPGGYADYVAVGARSSVRLPEELSTDLGALVEPLAVAHHALDLTPRLPGEPVLVLGAGPVGLAVALWARVLGATEVVVSDPEPHRRGLAAKLGMTVVDPSSDDVAGAFADTAGSRPRVIVECVGRPGVIGQAAELAADDAHLTLVGACTVQDTFFPIVATMKELTLQFVVYYRDRDFGQTVAALSSGRLDPSGLITGHTGLDDLPARFTSLMAPSDDCKVLVRP